MPNRYIGFMAMTWILFFAVGVVGGAIICDNKSVPLYEL